MDDMHTQIRPFFWLNIKKAAGRAIRRVLADDYIELEQRKRRPLARVASEQRNAWINNYRNNHGALRFHRMRLAKEVVYDSAEFESMFKFAFVRNPYDRAVSMWSYCGRKRSVLRRRRSECEEFKSFLRAIPSYWKRRIRMHHATHTRPMLPDIRDRDGKTVLLDFIGRVENMEQDFKVVCDRIGLGDRTVGRKNTSERRFGHCYQEYYDAEARRLVEDLYGEDIEFFDYRFDDPAQSSTGSESCLAPPAGDQQIVRL